MPVNRKLAAALAFSVLFVALVVAILALAATRTISFPFALLSLVALLGLYLGFGVLILAWRFVARLE